MINEINRLKLRKVSINTSHTIHFILTLFTFFWLFVWIFVALRNDSKIKKLDKQILLLELRNDYR